MKKKVSPRVKAVSKKRLLKGSGFFGDVWSGLKSVGKVAKKGLDVGGLIDPRLAVGGRLLGAVGLGRRKRVKRTRMLKGAGFFSSLKNIYSKAKTALSPYARQAYDYGKDLAKQQVEAIKPVVKARLMDLQEQAKDRANREIQKAQDKVIGHINRASDKAAGIIKGNGRKRVAKKRVAKKRAVVVVGKRIPASMMARAQRGNGLYSVNPVKKFSGRGLNIYG